MTGARKAGRMPVETEFCMVVTSLVSLVTNEEVLKWSVLAKEKLCSLRYSALRISAPSPCPQIAANFALPAPKIREISAQKTISTPLLQYVGLISGSDAHIHNIRHDQGYNQFKHGLGDNAEK